ncbi:MAG: serine/threonine-protein kinase, partial [Terriglobales bacterium]
MALTSGTKLGPYEIVSPLGAGGMGEVYRARDTRLGRDVAIKVLPEALANDADRLRRFEQEARTIAALNHPNILGIHDIGAHDGAPFLVSELLEGQTLRERLVSGPLPVRRAVEYALGIAQGLAAAHEKGIVHRDLKPENVFVTRDGRIKVLDFGLAKLVRPEENHEAAVTLTSPATLPGVVMGTVGYMSPEQVRGEPIDPRSDIFSFGAVLYEMLTGKRAFKRETSAETMTAILREEPQALNDTGWQGPLELQRILARCLEKNVAR